LVLDSVVVFSVLELLSVLPGSLLSVSVVVVDSEELVVA
jgi:hypothetical protein